jgi:hypothetical protein
MAHQFLTAVLVFTLLFLAEQLQEQDNSLAVIIISRAEEAVAVNIITLSVDLAVVELRTIRLTESLEL